MPVYAKGIFYFIKKTFSANRIPIPSMVESKCFADLIDYLQNGNDEILQLCFNAIAITLTKNG